jgi:hypothetical protein
MNDDRQAVPQAIYERTMRRLRVAIRLLTVVLLAVVARSVSDGLSMAGGITGTAIALLLISSLGLWRQGRRMRPDVNDRRRGCDDETGAGRAGRPACGRARCSR